MSFLKNLFSYFFGKDEGKEVLYVYVDIIITRSAGSNFNWIDANIIRGDMSKYIRSISKSSEVLFQSLYSFIYTRSGVDWVDMKIGGSTIDFVRPKVMHDANLYAQKDQVINSNSSIISIQYKL